MLLYDAKHDREFIAFHDIHMQVQTSPDAIRIENLDVANGHATQQRHQEKRVLETDTSLTTLKFNTSRGENQRFAPAQAVPHSLKVHTHTHTNTVSTLTTTIRLIQPVI